jgi:Flp pilus assembly protein TadD
MSSSNSETAETPSGQKHFALVCLVLALGTAALYWPITSHPFIIFDDEQYITANPHVASGLNWTNLVWALKSSEQANWHPLTWVSHQLDCTLFGVTAGGHHLVNLLFHVTNTLLVFLFLRGATGALWRSAFVAALFAWHPLHVESVAWAAERKDVLSTFFWLLTLMAYVRYAQKQSRVESRGSRAMIGSPALDARPSTLDYFAALFLFALGLMSKPMVVTLPFVLLLLDFWPLQRISDFRFPISDFKRLLLEKIPFFALAFAGSAVTYLVQAGGGAVVSQMPWSERLANVVLAYARYTAKIFWPTDLAIIYPHPRHWPVALALGAAAVLVVWTILCLRDWRKRPFLAVGWLWFLGTLVPTVGLIQVGAASMADRYTYIPSIGFFIVVVWGAAEIFSTRPRGKIILPVAGGAVLLACVVTTSLQISLWRDSITLFRHTIEVTTDNYAAENTLGKAYEKAGDDAHALFLYRAAVATEPRFPQSQFNLAMCLLTFGQTGEALEHLQAAAALEPRDPDIQFDLGIYFSQHASWTNAANCFSNSALVRPGYAPAQLGLGSAYANLGRAAEAAPHFREALRLDPKLSEAQKNLNRLLAEHPELR